MSNILDEESLVEDQKEMEKALRKQELDDIKSILRLPGGIRFFRRLFEKGRLFSTSFTGNSHTFYYEGHRNLALQFLEDVYLVAPDKISDIIFNKGDK